MKFDRLSRKQARMVLDLRENGPDCAKFISRRLGLHQAEVMEMLRELESSGWLERVKGTFLFKKGFRRPKHMNHTYYRITRPAEIELRALARKGKI